MNKIVFEDSQQKSEIHKKAMNVHYRNYTSWIIVTQTGSFKIQDAPGTAEKAREVTCGGSHVIDGMVTYDQKRGGMKRYME